MSFPEQISVVTWDDEEHNIYMKMTSVRQPCRKMGELAATSLIEQIESGGADDYAEPDTCERRVMPD